VKRLIFLLALACVGTTAWAQTGSTLAPESVVAGHQYDNVFVDAKFFDLSHGKKVLLDQQSLNVSGDLPQSVVTKHQHPMGAQSVTDETELQITRGAGDQYNIHVVVKGPGVREHFGVSEDFAKDVALELPLRKPTTLDLGHGLQIVFERAN
jgi:hypothetical protein